MGLLAAVFKERLKAQETFQDLGSDAVFSHSGTTITLFGVDVTALTTDNFEII